MLAAPAIATEDIERVYGSDQDVIGLATGTNHFLATAPAVATVITSKDIERLGATTVAEVLETVPGLHVSTERAISDIFVVRGFFHPFNPHILVLINGIPLNDVTSSGRPQAWSMPVHNISKIEVLRGPGSALYGADAFSGVVNILTKTAQDIRNSEAGLYTGSFDTAGAWVLYGQKNSSLEGVLSLETTTTNGYSSTVWADQQTRLDRLLGTSASLAPGPLYTGREDINARIDLAQPDRWRFRAAYQGFHDVGTGAGLGLALDPSGALNVALTSADFTYTLSLPKFWEGDAQASYLHTDTEADITHLPPGTFRGLFPDGIRNDFIYKVDQFRLGSTLQYSGFSRHRLRLGAGVNYTTVDTSEKVNYLTTPAGQIIPAGRFADTGELGIDKALPDVDRTLVYGFVQDEWRLSPDWHLTVGARIDHYSDFGTTVNPRLALVWNRTPDVVFKMLYGRAFRAPSFFDLYGKSPFVLVGNSAIR
ncbi:MAG TPA: TonB-dependent receptor, partial [Candidatus Competibacter sp.]|nr:TonB-dependent receptor [Candidatus Competibacter sp.]